MAIIYTPAMGTGMKPFLKTDGTTCYLNRPNLLSMVPKVLNEAVLGAEDGPLHQLDRAFAAHVLL